MKITSFIVRYIRIVFILCIFAIGKAQENNPEIIFNEEEATELEEVVINAGRTKYSKKNNPAYDLMQDVRKKAAGHSPLNERRYNFDFHDKIILALNEFQIGEWMPDNMQYLKKYEDISWHTFKPIVLISLKEKIGTRLYENHSKKPKSLILGSRYEGIDKSFNQENITKVLEDYLREIDIYDNEISLMQHHFVSPLSNIAGDFYRFQINDTVLFSGDRNRYVELSFAPVNPESFGFNGYLYVSTDSTRFVKRAEMRVPNALNLNYVNNIFVTLEYARDSLDNRHKILDDMSMELQILPGTPSFYARRTSAKKNFSYEDRKDLKRFSSKPGDEIFIDESFNQNDSQLWNQMRIVPLSQAEINISKMNDDMKMSPLFYWGEKIILILANGYIGTGVKGHKSRFDIGPVSTFISYNGLEGLRLRAGGITTAALSQHVFARAYVAYGFKDRKWKYMGELEYSFLPKKEHSREFPMHSIRATHKYDVDMVGQDFKFINADNIFLSINRKSNDLATYIRFSQLKYILELANHFSIEAGINHQIQYASRYVPFINGLNNTINNFGQASFFINLRFAPGEKFYQGKSFRSPINMDAPIFQLSHEYGPKGFLGSSFVTNITRASFQKRFWLSAAGYLDVLIEGGKIWSQVQFPLLLWPSANLSYMLQPESYALMNPMEFANDWYGSLDLTYWMDGLIFNRIPFIKKAKLREVVTFKLLTGGLTNKNNPEFHDNLFRFPYDSDTRILTKKPYMEIGIGLDNILTLFRLDYVWRLTYRDLPGISKSGLRFSFHLNF